MKDYYINPSIIHKITSQFSLLAAVGNVDALHRKQLNENDTEAHSKVQGWKTNSNPHTYEEEGNFIRDYSVYQEKCKNKYMRRWKREKEK